MQAAKQTGINKRIKHACQRTRVRYAESCWLMLGVVSLSGTQKRHCGAL